MHRPEPLINPPQLNRRGGLCSAMRDVLLRYTTLRAAAFAVAIESWGRSRRGLRPRCWQFSKVR